MPMWKMYAADDGVMIKSNLSSLEGSLGINAEDTPMYFRKNTVLIHLMVMKFSLKQGMLNIETI